MRDTRFVEREEGRRQALCPRCGGEVEWNFADDAGTRVEVNCADCGRYEMEASEFDAAEAEITGGEERRE